MTTVFLSTPRHTTHYVVDTHCCVAVSYPPLAIFSVLPYPSFGGSCCRGKRWWVPHFSHCWAICKQGMQGMCTGAEKPLLRFFSRFLSKHKRKRGRRSLAVWDGEKEFQFFSKALLRSAKTAGVTIYMRFLLLSARNSQNLDYQATPIELKNFKTIGSTDNNT